MPDPSSPDLSAVDTLAVRHRPRRLAEVVGQGHVTVVLRRALASGKLPRQLLFSGGSGLGKTTLARCVAAALCCSNPQDGDSCGVCPECVDVAAGTHPDVVEFDAASHGTKEQIRELAARALTSPARAAWRVYVIDEVHALSGGAQGAGTALLRLLEEPPAHVVFLLATTDPDKMLRTNRGRCVEFALRAPSSDEIARHLADVAAAEGVELPLPAAAEVVAATDPALGLRGALMSLERVLPLLASGTDPSEALSTGLGLAPAELRDELLSRLGRGELPEALEAAATIRARTGDAALRELLVRSMRAALRRAASDPAHLPAALDRLAMALESQPTPAGTDLLCARIALAAQPAAAFPAPAAKTPLDPDHPTQPVEPVPPAVASETSPPPPSHAELLETLRAGDRLAAAVLAAAPFRLAGGEIVVEHSPAASRIAALAERIERATGLRVRLERAE